MTAKRMLALLPLICLALTGCPQKRKVREKTAPASGPATSGSTSSKPSAAGTKTTAPKSGTRKRPASPPPKARKAATASKYQCTVAGNCILENRTCCPACLDISVDQMQAMNKPQWKRYQQACKAKKVECKKCRNPGFNANFVVLCEKFKCVVRDFRKSAHAKCSSDADCVLRAAPCCACAGPPVALSKAGLSSYQSERCGSKKCKACTAAEFTGVKAACVKGRCSMKGQWKKKKTTGGPEAKKTKSG